MCSTSKNAPLSRFSLSLIVSFICMRCYCSCNPACKRSGVKLTRRTLTAIPPKVVKVAVNNSSKMFTIISIQEKKNAAFPFQHISNHLARIKQNQQLFPLYVELSHQDKKRCSQNSSREYRACITNKIDDLLSKNPYKKLQTTSVSYEYRQKTIGHSLFIFSSKPFRLATFYSH